MESTTDSPNSKPKLSRSQLMDEIIGIRRNSDKKVIAKDNILNHKHEPLNKTMAPLSLEEAELEQENKAMLQMTVSRKRENYSQLKKWDAQRSEELQLHINGIEGLHTEVDVLIKSSIDNLEAYITFFKERAKCEVCVERFRKG